MTDVYASDDYREMLAGIKAEPDEDLPRLAMADWLDDHGEATRAELIRLMIQPRRAADGRPAIYDHRTREAKRLHYLVTRYFFDVAGETGWPTVYEYYPPPERDAPGPGGHAQFTRGFVEAVTCPAAAWVAHGDQLLAREPVRAVTLTGLPFPQMATPPWRSEQADDPAHWWYWYAALSDVRYTLKELCDALGVTPYMALRVNQVIEGVFRLRWPGVELTLPPEPPTGRIVSPRWRATPFPLVSVADPAPIQCEFTAAGGGRPPVRAGEVLPLVSGHDAGGRGWSARNAVVIRLHYDTETDRWQAVACGGTPNRTRLRCRPPVCR